MHNRLIAPYVITRRVFTLSDHQISVLVVVVFCCCFFCFVVLFFVGGGVGGTGSDLVKTQYIKRTEKNTFSIQLVCILSRFKDGKKEQGIQYTSIVCP